MNVKRCCGCDDRDGESPGPHERMVANAGGWRLAAATEGAAVAKAVHLLGEAAWDMVGPGPAYATPGADEAIHFRLTGR